MIMMMSCQYYVMILCHSNADTMPMLCDGIMLCDDNAIQVFYGDHVI